MNGNFGTGSRYDQEPVGEVRHGPLHPWPDMRHALGPVDWMMHVYHPYYIPNQPPPPPCGCCCHPYPPPMGMLQSPLPCGFVDYEHWPYCWPW